MIVINPSPGKLLLKISPEKFEGVLLNAVNNKCLTDSQTNILSDTVTNAILGKDMDLNVFTIFSNSHS